MQKILLVEDDKDLNETLKESLELETFSVESVFSAEEGLERLKHEQFGLILSDVKMPGMSGYEFLEVLKRQNHQIPVLLMTAYGTIEQAVGALKSGACDYLTKPFDMQELIAKIKMNFSKTANLDLPVMASAKTKKVFDLALKVAHTDACVLIQGESGTGKEVLAQFIHQASNRSKKPIVSINCAAIPENMLEATLFGYEKGAFTGAYQSTPGKFEQAHKGTILLDEISEMPLALQAKILRVLQEQEVERLGSKSVFKLDVRVIATTNRILKEEVANQQFREDLYFRLNVFPIQWPPLRERKEDILPIAQRFVDHHRGGELTDAAQQTLLQYPWPGNIRELQNVMQRACILTNGIIDANDLHFEQEPSAETDMDLESSRFKAEFETIMDVLTQTKGNREQAASLLGISPRTLRYKVARLKKEGFDIPKGGL